MERLDELLSVKEAARHLKLSPLTIKRYIYKGKLAATKTPGGQHRIRRGELEKLMGEKIAEIANYKSLKEAAGVQIETELATIEAQLNNLGAKVEKLEERLIHREGLKPEINIMLLGIGCKACDRLTNMTCGILSELGLEEMDIRRVKDIRKIAEFGPLGIPALIVNDKVLVSGRVPSRGRLLKLLRDEMNN